MGQPTDQHDKDQLTPILNLPISRLQSYDVIDSPSCLQAFTPKIVVGTETAANTQELMGWIAVR